MMVDAELMAYVDGELDAAAKLAFEARLAQEPALQQALAREQRLRATLQDAFAPVLEEPVPARLSGLLKPAPVISLAAVRERRAWTWAQWGGMAASLVLGAVLSRGLLPGEATDPLLARGALAQALDQQLSGQTRAGVTPGLSFIAKGGGYCRSFTLDGSQAGLACREGDAWRLRHLVPAQTQASEFRTASTAVPPDLLQSIEALREGEVLDADGERRAREQGWRRR